MAIMNTLTKARRFTRVAAAVSAAALLAGSITSTATAQPPPGTPIPNAAAPTKGPLKGLSLDEIDNTVGTIEAIVDVVGSWIGPKPPPSPQFGYAESRGFDMQMHQSLGAKLPKVNVLVDGRFTAEQVPQRMGNWLNQVRKHGGTVSECVMTENRSILFFLQLIMRVIAAVDTWLMYQPAGAYNAVLLVNEQGHQVKNVIFVEKTQPQMTCPGGATPTLVP